MFIDSTVLCYVDKSSKKHFVHTLAIRYVKGQNMLTEQEKRFAVAMIKKEKKDELLWAMQRWTSPISNLIIFTICTQFIFRKE